jgi:hypothetical protein
MFTLNGTPISIDNEYVAPNGTQYPHLRDPSIRQQLGIVEVADPAHYDQRFYWGVGNPKQLEDLEITPENGDPYTQTGLKSQWIAQTKAVAGSLLAQTDWMVIRKAERGIAIPLDVVAARGAIILDQDSKQQAIEAATTVEELIAAVQN